MTKKAKLIIDGKEIEVEITQEQLDKLYPPKKKSGYERVKTKQTYYVVFGDSSVESVTESCGTFEDSHYIAANYYSDKTVAENNARSDKLMRRLRRFAVEHRKKELDWSCRNQDAKCKILYNYGEKTFDLSYNYTINSFGTIYFDSKETAKLAIDTFKDELLWYFTEYKDSL